MFFVVLNVTVTLSCILERRKQSSTQTTFWIFELFFWRAFCGGCHGLEGGDPLWFDEIIVFFLYCRGKTRRHHRPSFDCSRVHRLICPERQVLTFLLSPSSQLHPYGFLLAGFAFVLRSRSRQPVLQLVARLETQLTSLLRTTLVRRALPAGNKEARGSKHVFQSLVLVLRGGRINPTLLLRLKCDFPRSRIGLASFKLDSIGKTSAKGHITLFTRNVHSSLRVCYRTQFHKHSLVTVVAEVSCF